MLALITAATSEPVTRAEAKDHLRITGNDDDALVDELIGAATDFCQRSVPGGREFLSATYELSLDKFPANSGSIELPRPPLQSVTTVKYYDATNTEQTLDSTDYYVNCPTHEPGWVEPAPDTYWPETKQRDKAVTVRFVAGYVSRHYVPATVKQAIKMLCSHWNENREAVVVGTISKEVEFSVNSLLGVNDWGFYA